MERFIFLQEWNVLFSNTFSAGLLLHSHDLCGWLSVVNSALPEGPEEVCDLRSHRQVLTGAGSAHSEVPPSGLYLTPTPAIFWGFPAPVHGNADIGLLVAGGCLASGFSLM